MKKKEEKVIFEEVYKSHKEFVYNIVRKILKREKDDIKDLCQEIWILIFKKLDQFDKSKGAIEGWLYRIASNHVFKYFKKEQLSKNIISINNFDYNFYCSPEAFKNEKEKEQKEKIELIKKKSSELKKGQKEIFRLYYFQGLKHDEIAEIKGLSPNTSKSQLMRAKAKIKQLIS
jgi:RNA polymerase sigma-70 factor (ECF subfamily)